LSSGTPAEGLLVVFVLGASLIIWLLLASMVVLDWATGPSDGGVMALASLTSLGFSRLDASVTPLALFAPLAGFPFLSSMRPLFTGCCCLFATGCICLFAMPPPGALAMLPDTDMLCSGMAKSSSMSSSKAK
jgi:hypothetical protein